MSSCDISVVTQVRTVGKFISVGGRMTRADTGIITLLAKFTPWETAGAQHALESRVSGKQFSLMCLPVEKGFHFLARKAMIRGPFLPSFLLCLTAWILKLTLKCNLRETNV